MLPKVKDTLGLSNQHNRVGGYSIFSLHVLVEASLQSCSSPTSLLWSTAELEALLTF